jgi:hypothetical protein
MHRIIDFWFSTFSENSGDLSLPLLECGSLPTDGQPCNYCHSLQFDLCICLMCVFNDAVCSGDCVV